MKRHKNLTIVGIILFLGVLLGLECLREGSHVFQNSMTDGHLRSLSMWIELYREDQSRYLDSLPDLLQNIHEDEKAKQAIRSLIDQVQHNVWRDNYDYKHSTNSFTLIVTGPDGYPMGWFGKQRSIEKHYAIGEALKQ
jgi:predicted PurR-regulated permease PerM